MVDGENKNTAFQLAVPVGQERQMGQYDQLGLRAAAGGGEDERRLFGRYARVVLIQRAVPVEYGADAVFPQACEGGAVPGKLGKEVAVLFVEEDQRRG